MPLRRAPSVRFTKKHDIRCQHATTGRAGRHQKAGKILILQIHVAVRGLNCVELSPGVAVHQQVLKVRARQAVLAGKATAHPVKPSMQINDLLASSRLVQVIKILGGHCQLVSRLRSCQRVVGDMGTTVRKRRRFRTIRKG